MIFLSNSLCKTRDWVFTEIFDIRIINENVNTAITSVSIPGAYPIPAKEITNNTKETNRGTLLLNLATSQLEIGKPIRELMGMTSNKLPSSASLKSKFDLMEGILAAQEAKQNPVRKKNMLKEILCFDR